MTPEGKLTEEVRAYFSTLSPGLWSLKVWGNSFQKSGIPDFLCCYKGRFLGIELKAPGKKPRKLQAVVLEEIRQAGGLVTSATTLAEVIEFIEKV